MGTHGDWLTRYERGERAQVWFEIRQLGAVAREHPEHGVVQAVCDRMGARARQNVEAIIERLLARGYRFHTNDDEQEDLIPHYAPSDGAPELARWLERRFKSVPMTLLAWLRQVGDVWLVGSDPEWVEAAAADPLVLEIEGSRWAPQHDVRQFYERRVRGLAGRRSERCTRRWCVRAAGVARPPPQG